MMRAAIYAHFDIHGIVDDYVLHALRCFRKYFDVVVFASCSTLSREQKARAEALVDAVVITGKPAGVFPRWSGGFEAIAREQCAEIFFIDDSFYGPCGDAARLMEHSRLSMGDLWAAVVECHPSIHVRSSFMCFKTPLLQSGFAKQFWSSVKNASIAEATTRQFEIELTDRLHQCGFHLDAMVRLDGPVAPMRNQVGEDDGSRQGCAVEGNADSNVASDLDFKVLDRLLRSGVPFVPTTLFEDEARSAACRSILRNVRETRRYGSRLITDHAHRVYDFVET